MTRQESEGTRGASKLVLALLAALMVGIPHAALAVEGSFAGVSQCFVGGRWVTVKGNCPAPSGGAPSRGGGGGGGAAGAALYGGFYSLGYAFGQWLVGGDSDPQAEADRRAMMEELKRRQEEAERQKREEEARRLAEMYNRLVGTLKLSGFTELKLKGVGSGGELKLKTGDGGGGIAGLPGIYLEGGDKPYGIPGLPGIYTGGPGGGSGLTASGLRLKLGDGGASAVAPAPQAAAELPAPAGPPPDLSKMTPQQLADVAEMFSRLPAEEQVRLMTMAQAGPAAAGDGAAPGVTPPAPGPSGAPLPAAPPAALAQQAAASQAAAAAPTPEVASDLARAGFDRPLDAPPAVRPDFAAGRTPAAAPTGAGAMAAAAATDFSAAPPSTRPTGATATSGTTGAAEEGIDADAAARRYDARAAPRRTDRATVPAPAVAQPAPSAIEPSSASLRLKLSSPPETATHARQEAAWRNALSCAVEEACTRAEPLGPDGKRFAAALRAEFARVVAEASRMPAEAGDVTVANATLDRMLSVSGETAPQQSIVTIAVHRKGDGRTVVDVMSHLPSAAGEAWEGQVVVEVDRAGGIEVKDATPSFEKCLGR